MKEYPDEVLAEQLGMTIGKSACERGNLDDVFFEPKSKEQKEAEERIKEAGKEV
jgi:hypothetical protein